VAIEAVRADDADQRDPTSLQVNGSFVRFPGHILGRLRARGRLGLIPHLLSQGGRICVGNHDL